VICIDRLKLYGYEYNDPEDVEAGIVRDGRTSLDDLLVYTGKRKLSKQRFTIDKPAPRRRKERSPNGRHQILQRSLGRSEKDWISDTPGSSLYHSLLKVTERDANFQRRWQRKEHMASTTRGRKGEPYYRDPAGFERVSDGN